MKVSFNLPSSNPPRPTLKSLQDQASSSAKEFFRELDPSETLTKLSFNVIPPIANEWGPQKKMRLTNLPDKSEDPNLEFQVGNSIVELTDSNISYGLNHPAKKDSKLKIDRFRSDSSIERLMLSKLRNDLVRLPEHGGMDEFEDMPVENFATALLKGYGWHEGRGVGKNAKEDVKVFEIKQRIGREGIGFVNDIPMPPTNNYSNNKYAKVVKDRIHGVDRSKDSLGSRNHKHDARYDKKASSKRAREKHETCATSSKSWLCNHIRVRVISKELKGGRLYLQKGEIVDVVGSTTCNISTDNSRELIQGVEQEFLQTALPRRGGPVLVLYGRHKGVYGSLQETDMDNKTAVVRDADTSALLNVKLEQIAEYVGDPVDIGY